MGCGCGVGHVCVRNGLIPAVAFVSGELGGRGFAFSSMASRTG